MKVSALSKASLGTLPHALGEECHFASKRRDAGHPLDMKWLSITAFIRHLQVSGPSTSQDDSLANRPAALGMRRLGSMLARLKPSPFKATARAGRSRLHYLAGRTRASAPT